MLKNRYKQTKQQKALATLLADSEDTDKYYYLKNSESNWNKFAESGQSGQTGQSGDHVRYVSLELKKRDGGGGSMGKEKGRKDGVGKGGKLGGNMGKNGTELGRSYNGSSKSSDFRRLMSFHLSNKNMKIQSLPKIPSFCSKTKMEQTGSVKITDFSELKSKISQISLCKTNKNFEQSAENRVQCRQKRNFKLNRQRFKKYQSNDTYLKTFRCLF